MGEGSRVRAENAPGFPQAIACPLGPGAGDDVRINVQLIEAADDRHLWAEMFDRKLEDVLALHSDVVRAIVGAVKVTLTPEDEVRLAVTRSVDPETYELYIKGMFHLHKYTLEGFETGLKYLNQAVEIDPMEPLAYAGLSVGYSLIGHEADPSAYEKSRAAAEKALELDDTLAEVHQSFAEIAFYVNWDVADAKTRFENVISLNPNLAIAHAQYAWLLMLVPGKDDEVSAEMKRAVELDPLNPVYYAWAAWQNWWLGEIEIGIEWARNSLQLSPDFPWGLYILGCLQGSEGKFEEAIEAHTKVAEVRPDLKWPLGYTYALSGQADKAMAIAREVAVQPGPMDTWGLAEIYTALGENDEAFRWLDEAVESRWGWLIHLQLSVNFRPLHDDPRFQELLNRIRDSKISS